MIISVYFKDALIQENEDIKNLLPHGIACSNICGSYGITSAFQDLDFIHNEIDSPHAILTNNPLVVDYAKEIANISWNNIYLFDWKKRNFAPAQETTNKDLRDSHIFSRLFMGKTFANINAAVDMEIQQKLNDEAIDKLYSYIK